MFSHFINVLKRGNIDSIWTGIGILFCLSAFVILALTLLSILSPIWYINVIATSITGAFVLYNIATYIE